MIIISKYKLQRRTKPPVKKGNLTQTQYNITLPKNIVEEIARWQMGTTLEVEWIEKGKNFPINKPYFRISKPDHLWTDTTEKE